MTDQSCLSAAPVDLCSDLSAVEAGIGLCLGLHVATLGGAITVVNFTEHAVFSQSTVMSSDRARRGFQTLLSLCANLDQSTQ